MAEYSSQFYVSLPLWNNNKATDLFRKLRIDRDATTNLKKNEDQEPSLETSKFSLYFSGSCIPINSNLSYYCHYLHWHRPFKIKPQINVLNTYSILYHIAHCTLHIARIRQVKGV